MGISTNVKYALITVQPASMILVIIGSIGLYNFGLQGLFSAPYNIPQIASAGAVGVGALSYMAEQGIILSNS